MPIKIPNSLPATGVLESENIFVITESRAISQDIRPLHILLLNLMPTKVATETQLARVLGNTPLQVELELLQVRSHESNAPVEHLPFEAVDYWDELCEIMAWSKSHVHSTFHICWGAQAGLYYHYGIPKIPLDSKLFGVFPHRVERKSSILFRGFDDVFMVPHSRHTTVLRRDVEAVGALKILASSEEAGIYAMATDQGRQVFITGHSEYDPDTLEKEYLRDKSAGLPIEVPKNYYPNDDDTKPPLMSWRAHANLLYSNWLNYFVYQNTPYDLSEIQA